jgi:hypothetical protein
MEEHFWDTMDTVASLSLSLDRDRVEMISIWCAEKKRGRHIQLPCA